MFVALKPIFVYLNISCIYLENLNLVPQVLIMFVEVLNCQPIEDILKDQKK